MSTAASAMRPSWPAGGTASVPANMTWFIGWHMTRPATVQYYTWEPARRDEGIHHMRKVYAGLFSSIDGVVERPNEWQPAFDDEMGAALARMLDGQDAVLLGRVTFTEWAGYWPTSTDEPFASWINGTQKYVASTTLASADSWENSTLIISPVVAGGGRQRLFADDAAPAKFELAEATPTSTGALIATYRPAR